MKRQNAIAVVVPDPQRTTLPAIRTRCQEIYARRDELIGRLDINTASTAMRQVGALERFIGNREGRDDVRRSARILECAVGAALGLVRAGDRLDLQPSLASEGSAVPADDRYRCRLLFKYRHVWEPVLETEALSRLQTLTLIQREIARSAALTRAQTATLDDIADQVLHASFQTVAADLANDSIDLVFTDPPYHDKTLDVYRDLGTVAARILKPGASLITYIAHHRLPEILGMLQAAGLTFFWPLAMVHTGAKARMTEYGIVVHWKPLLWFVKGAFRSREDMRLVDDLIESIPEKDTHPWQQSTVEARYYIERLTQPDGLVFDPFCGGGTTAIAAAQTMRRCLTCDTDEEVVYLARQRLREHLAVPA